MNYGGPQDQRYGGGQSLTDGYDYDGEKNYYGQQGQQQLPSFPSFSNMRGTQQPPSHPYHGGLHQSSPSLLSERVLPPMSSVARGPSSMSAGGSDMGVSALSAAAAAHQMSRLGEAFKDSLVHQMGKSSPSGSLGPGPSSYGLAQQQPYGLSTSGHSDRLYGGSANPFPNHGGALSGSSGSLSEKSSPRSSTQRSSGEAGYGLPTVTTRGSGDRGVQLPAPSISTQLGANGAAHQAAVSLSHIASGAGSQLHPSSTSVSTQQQQQPTAGRTAASMNPKDLLELYSKWDQLDNKAKSKNEEVHAEEVRKERHNMAEKRRRSDMNGAIERLKTLLPQQVTNDRRLTKVEVLTEAADHLTQVQNLCAKLITENKRLKALVPGVKMEDDDAFLTRGNDDDATSANNATVPTSDSSGSGSNNGDDVSSHEDERRPATADERCSDGGDFGEGQQPSAKRLRRSSPGDSSAGSGSDSNGSGREGDAGASSSSESASTDNQQRHNNIVGAPHSRHNSVGSDSQQSGSGGDDGRGERDGEGPVRVPSDDDGRTPHLHHHVIDEGVEGRDSDNSNDGVPTASTSKRRRTTSGAADQGEPTTFANLHFPSSTTSSTPSTSSSTSSSLSSSSSAAEMSAASAYGHHYHHQPQQQQHYGGGTHHHHPQQQHYGGSGLGQHQQQPHPYHHHPQHHM